MMSANPRDLARDAEISRARLDLTIERLQSRLTPLGLFDEVTGLAQRSSAAPLVDRAIGALRENPLPLFLIAAGIGLLARNIVQRREYSDWAVPPKTRLAGPAAAANGHMQPPGNGDMPGRAVDRAPARPQTHSL